MTMPRLETFSVRARDLKELTPTTFSVEVPSDSIDDRVTLLLPQAIVYTILAHYNVQLDQCDRLSINAWYSKIGDRHIGVIGDKNAIVVTNFRPEAYRAKSAHSKV